MMENKNIQVTLHCLKTMLCTEHCEECPVYGETGTDHCEEDAVRYAIQALEENQQYRAIGTVEGYERAIQSSIENYNLYREYKGKVQEFESIGTVEEFKALKEKSKPKKVKDEYETSQIQNGGYCPNCGCGITSRWGYCQNCGQAVNWQNKFKDWSIYNE